MNIGLLVLSFEVALRREKVYLLFITESEITLVQMDFKRNSLCCKLMLTPFINIFQLNESLLLVTFILPSNP